MVNITERPYFNEVRNSMRIFLPEEITQPEPLPH